MARDDFQLESNKPIGRGSFGTVFTAFAGYAYLAPATYRSSSLLVCDGCNAGAEDAARRDDVTCADPRVANQKHAGDEQHASRDLTPPADEQERQARRVIHSAQPRGGRCDVARKPRSEFDESRRFDQ